MIKSLLKRSIAWMLSIGMILLASGNSLAFEGICGYDGGISSGDVPGKTSYEYQEMSFISGEPILLKGTMTIKKTQKQDLVTSNYTYTLSNLDKGATLSRTIAYNTKQTKKENGQIIEETTLNGNPTESCKLGGQTYTLKSYDFSRSSLIDPKPAVNYYAGNIWGRKIYQLGTGTTGSGNITLDINGKFYGYDQCWGTTEAMMYDYYIQSEQKGKEGVVLWGGVASVNLSATTFNQLIYQPNQPEEISFDGGYLKKQNNNSILEYEARLPEFDAQGIATDNVLETKDSLKIETFPVQTGLLSPDLSQLRGHWAENDIKSLFSLEALSSEPAFFVPEEYMKRSEFAFAIVNAAKEGPKDPALLKSGSTATKTKTEPIVSPFIDVSNDSRFIKEITNAYHRGFIVGVGESRFSPDNYLIVADAITILIRALGLENMAPNPAAVTGFLDNDEIPGYARNAAYVAQRIGIVKGDDKGYLRPMERLTNARAAALVNRFIGYMNEGIKKDYRERLVNFN